MVEEPRGDVLLAGGQLSHGPFEMLFDDVLGSAQAIESLDAKHIGAEARSSSHSRCMTSWRYGASSGAVFSALHRAEATESGLDRPAPTSSSTRSTSSGSMLTASPVELRVAIDRADDRRGRSLTVEAIEPEGVREQARDATREAVELRERVLSQRDEDVDPKRRGQHPRESLGERPGPAVVRVVEEVLLGLVEDEVDVAVLLCVLECLERRAVRAPPLASATAWLSAAEGSSLQREKTTTSGSSGSSRSDRATAAPKSDDLPTPLGP